MCPVLFPSKTTAASTTADGVLVVHHRLMQSVPNFRDIGGYATRDGRTIRSGVLFRSDSLSDLTEEDQRYLERLNIHRIVDFRTSEEIARAPDKLPPSLRACRVNLPIGEQASRSEGAATLAALQRLLEGDHTALDALMIASYPKLAREFSVTYRAWLHGLIDAPVDSAQVFHCTGGRDRTGFAAAILLLALGVDRDEVTRDYLASNDGLEDGAHTDIWKARMSAAYGMTVSDHSVGLLRVKRDYLDAAFHAMETDHGSVDTYLHQALGVDNAFRERLREYFLD